MSERDEGIVLYRCRFDQMGENYNISERARHGLNELGKRDPLAAAMLGPVLEAQQAQRDAFGGIRCKCWLEEDGTWNEKACEVHGTGR